MKLIISNRFWKFLLESLDLSAQLQRGRDVDQVHAGDQIHQSDAHTLEDDVAVL